MRVTDLQSGPSWARNTGYGLGGLVNGGKHWPRMKALGQPLKGLEVETDRVLNRAHGATKTPAGTRGPRSRQYGCARASPAEAGGRERAEQKERFSADVTPGFRGKGAQGHVGRRPGLGQTRAAVVAFRWALRDLEGGTEFCRPSLSQTSCRRDHMSCVRG